ncbi:unnamed protein product [Clavelina lepadiformis]|uniref:SMODS and SLOG-associating 2TM effector domain-containing protein n=1 Tax=Clavelina lepadiformis TaxID=159417 RepID=A0ABP0GU56_CLALP
MGQENGEETHSVRLTEDNDATKTNQEASTSSQAKEYMPTSIKAGESAPKKRTKPTFLEREIVVKNHQDVNHIKALKALSVKFQKGYLRWQKRTGIFKLANLIVTLLVIVLQVAQVIVFQIQTVENETKQALATILPAITGAILAIQLKLKWAEKSQKCKKAAKLYNTLGQHVNYRIDVAEADGITEDTVKLLNTALLSINKEVPAFLTAY